MDRIPELSFRMLRREGIGKAEEGRRQRRGKCDRGEGDKAVGVRWSKDAKRCDAKVLLTPDPSMMMVMKVAGTASMENGCAPDDGRSGDKRW